MDNDDTRHAQTELSEDEYERFRKFARERGLSLEKAGHEALLEWIERQQRTDPNDPAFTVLDELDDESLPDSAETDGRDEADLDEESHDSDEPFGLADDPSVES